MKLITLGAFSIAVSVFGVMLYTWFAAYLNPNKAVTIFINRQGEMNLELIAFPIILIFLIVCLAYEWKNWIHQTQSLNKSSSPIC